MSETDPINGDDCLVSHPWYGSVWLLDVKVSIDEGGTKHVTGGVEDRSLPRYMMGVMNFPATCIRKIHRHTTTDSEGERDHG